MGEPRPRIVSVYRYRRDRDRGRMAWVKYMVAPRPGPDPGRLVVEITRVWGKHERDIPDVRVDSPDREVAFARARQRIQDEHPDMLVDDPGDAPGEAEG